MSRALRRPLSIAALVVVGAGAALAGTAAYGSLTDSSGNVIKACYKPSNGTVYIIGRDSNRSTCQPGDSTIQWNVQGLKGDTGEQGPKGDTGLTGPKGDTGLTGPKGDTGLQGAKGDTGVQGAKGDTGLQGDPGPQGPKGDTGPAGGGGTFSGVFTSPNGLYTLSVTNSGIVLQGPGGSLTIDRGLISLLGDPWYALEGSPR